MKTIRVGLIGSGFITSIHYEAMRRVAGVEVVAVASPTPGNAERFATDRGIARHFTDFRALLDIKDLDLVVLGLPNDLHCTVACQAAQAGKHIVVEKPMAMNLAECDRMIAACQQAGVMLGYAEELCFTPKYVRLKQLVDEGAFGKIHLVKQSEKTRGHASHRRIRCMYFAPMSSAPAQRTLPASGFKSRTLSTLASVI
jgi:myo-inositol 2-dehydrogenase / D-chiro-inositol 1-dehydrogenase